MNNINQLDHLSPIADEMLAGLQADEAMRLKILRAARAKPQTSHRKIKRFAPVMAVAAAALVCVGVASSQLGRIDASVMPVEIGTIAAGDAAQPGARMMADLGDGASVRMTRSAGGASLFAEGGAEIPVVSVGGGVYRMLVTPQDIGSALLGKALGSVRVVTHQPSLASDAELASGLSNVAEESAAIYAVGGLDAATAVAAEVDGSVRLFQRVSYAGKGPAGASLEDTFCVRGKVKSAALDGVGEIEGGKANDVIAVLLDQATLKSADAFGAKQFLTVTLDSGLRLQLGVSGDTLIGCGGWSCPEFFDAFEAALE